MVYKRFLFLTLTVLSAQLSLANALPEREFVRRNFPAFEEVFTHIMMSLNFYCDDCYYGIAKKPDGYFLSVTPFEGDAPTKYIQVWERNLHCFDPKPGCISKGMLLRNTSRFGIETM